MRQEPQKQKCVLPTPDLPILHIQILLSLLKQRSNITPLPAAQTSVHVFMIPVIQSTFFSCMCLAMLSTVFKSWSLQCSSWSQRVSDFMSYVFYPRTRLPFLLLPILSHTLPYPQHSPSTVPHIAPQILTESLAAFYISPAAGWCSPSPLVCWARKSPCRSQAANTRAATGRGSFSMGAESPLVPAQPGPSLGSVPLSPEIILGAQQLPTESKSRALLPLGNQAKNSP